MQKLLQEYRCAMEAAEQAANIIQDSKKTSLIIDTKSGTNDLVTQFDRLVEECVIDHLSKTFPTYDIIGEESGESKGHHDFCWIIDPIDGTTNFIKGIPWYAVSIGLYFMGQPVVGVVLNPESQTMYHGLRGSGSWVRHGSAADRRLQVSPVESMENALFLTGFYYDRGDIFQRTLKDIESLTLAGCLGIRRLGAASLDLCMVAEGRAEAYFEHQLNVWDFAAGGLIASEAGAWVGTPSGANLPMGKSGVLAASPTILDQALLFLGKSSFGIQEKFQ